MSKKINASADAAPLPRAQSSTRRTWACRVVYGIFAVAAIRYLRYMSLTSDAPNTLDSHSRYLDTPSSRPTAYVGLSLSLTHAAASISFGNSTNLTVPVGVVEAAEEYRDAFLTLTNPEMGHVHPPYYGCASCAWDPAEKLRQMRRSIRKRVGLPATPEVGALATPLAELLFEASKIIVREGFEWAGLNGATEALLVTPAAQSLYDEDINDIMHYLSIRQAVSPHNEWPDGGVFEMGCQGPYEAQAAFAAAGLGICEHWQDRDQCRNESASHEQRYFLAVEYTRNGLIVSRAGMRMAELSDGYYNTMDSWIGMQGFGSVYQQLEQYPEQYWSSVLIALEQARVLDGAGCGYNITDVFLFGESAANPQFLLEEFILSFVAKHQKDTPQVHRADPLYAVSNGAAELAKRGRWWSEGVASGKDEVAHGQLREHNPDPQACPFSAHRLYLTCGCPACGDCPA